MNVIEEPIIAPGFGLGGKGAVPIVVDNEEHHQHKAGDGNEAVAPTGDVLADPLPMQVEQAVESK